MTDIKKLAFVGLMSLGLATVGSAGCSSSNGSGTGGSTGTGGTGTGTGGTHTGGSTGTGGTAGNSGAAGATLGCSTSAAPASPEIANFSGADASIQIMGGTFTYGSTPMPVFTIGTGSVNVTDTVQVAGGPHYQGFGIFFNGDTAGLECIDATTYTGIQFDLSGSLTGTGCSMVFSINDSEHADSTALKADGTVNDPKAAGPKGSYAPQLPITSAQLTSTPTTIMVPFTGSGANVPSGGSPSTPIDPTKIEGVQWQMATPTPADGGATECDWNINIANVKFYK
jgi:hypothetical protein